MRMNQVAASSKRKIMELWNQGDWAINQISLRFDIEQAELEAWLWNQPGFPKLITHLRAGRPRGYQVSKRASVTTVAKLKEYLNAQPHS